MPIFVNDEYIDDSEIRREAELLRQQLFDADFARDALTFDLHVWEAARENVIGRVLLKQAALAGTAPLPHETVDSAAKSIKEQAPGQSGCLFVGSDEELRRSIDAELRTEQFIAQITSGIKHPKNSEISDYYRQHRDEFYSPEVVHVSHIVKNIDEHTNEAAALGGIQEADRALKADRSFAEVADTYSDCPGRGGDLGFFTRGEMVEEFEAVVFALREGETSDIFRTPFGFHIAKLHEKRPEGIRPLHEVRGEIENAILKRKRHAAIAQVVEQLRERASIRRVSR